VSTSPPSLDPDGAWAYELEGAPSPRPRKLSRPLLIVVEAVAAVVAGAAVAWAVAVAVDLSEFISTACSLSACPDRAIPDHLTGYGEALFGFAGAFAAARTSWRGARLARGHGHLAGFERGLLMTIVLLAAWSLLATGAIAG
jgi:hypothetical protein